MTEMNTDATIYVAGHGGLVGSALVRRLRAAGYGNLVLRSHADLDLTNQYAVQRFFSETRPEYVFVAAAKVGGIVANNSSPADFILDNLQIATNVIHEAYRNGVKRLLFLGSSCAYLKLCRPANERRLSADWPSRNHQSAIRRRQDCWD
jgi:GDP-L-fucose synthase